MDERSLQEIRLNDLFPLLGLLGKDGVKARDLKKLLSDHEMRDRVALFIQAGGHDLTANERTALRLFGPDRFLNCKEVLTTYCPDSDESRGVRLRNGVQVPYGEGTLRECCSAFRNTWRLVYHERTEFNILIDSLRKMNINVVVDGNGVVGELSSIQLTPSGYHLVNINQLFECGKAAGGKIITWHDQQAALNKHSELRRCPLDVVLEMFLMAARLKNLQKWFDFSGLYPNNSNQDQQTLSHCVGVGNQDSDMLDRILIVQFAWPALDLIMITAAQTDRAAIDRGLPHSGIMTAHSTDF